MSFDIKLSPSMLEYYSLCPVYQPEKRDSRGAAAEEGDLLHEAVEKEDTSILQDDEQIEAARECIMYVRGLSPSPKPEGGQIAGSILSYDEVYKEMWLESDIGKRGRADRVIRPASDRKHIDCVDYKFGRRPVSPAKVNLQGKDYAYRLFRKFPDVDEVTVHFLMPRLREISVHTFRRTEDLASLREDIMSVHRAVNDPFKVPTPNLDKACEFCGLRASCPALSGSLVSLAKRSNMLPLPSDFSPSSPRTPAERGLAQVLADIMINWGTEVKRQNTEAVLNGGQEAEGYAPSKRKGKTTISDTPEFAREVCERYEIDPMDLLVKAGSLSFPKTVDLLKEFKPDLTAKQISETVEAELGHLIRKSPEVTFLRRVSAKKLKEVSPEVQAAQKALMEQTQSAKEEAE